MVPRLAVRNSCPDRPLASTALACGEDRASLPVSLFNRETTNFLTSVWLFLYHRFPEMYHGGGFEGASQPLGAGFARRTAPV